MPTDNIQMLAIKPEDCDKVVKFLIDNFYPYAPLSSCVPKSLPLVDDEEVHKYIAYGCSIMAVEDGQLVGVSIALPKNAAAIEEYFATAAQLGNTKGGHILRLLGQVNRDARIFERYGVEEILYLFLSCVAPDQRGRNIAARMTRELMTLGKRWNYKVLTLDCSSFYCARVCERLGMECLNTVEYRQYLDESGQPIFSPALPHVAMKTYGQRLL